MEKLSEFFVRSCGAIERTLDELVRAAEIEPSRLLDAVRWSLFGGGKRFRPCLMLAVGKVFGSSGEALWRTAAAVELIHTYSLVHDDLPAMDDDDLRRGRATVHMQFGEATAILTGDLLQMLAFQAIADDRALTEATRLQLVSELATATSRMVQGQQMDLVSEGHQVEAGEVEAIHRNKTGALICFAARAGAVIANAGRDELRAVTKYSAKLGLLFQITDDVLDVTQASETLGKTAAKDVAAGKATYPSIYGLDGSRRMIREIHAEAIARLDEIARPTGILRDIADFIVERES
jgi:geranylgeranyl pyrophosphate synthase